MLKRYPHEAVTGIRNYDLEDRNASSYRPSEVTTYKMTKEQALKYGPPNKDVKKKYNFSIESELVTWLPKEASKERKRRRKEGKTEPRKVV